MNTLGFRRFVFFVFVRYQPSRRGTHHPPARIQKLHGYCDYAKIRPHATAGEAARGSMPRTRTDFINSVAAAIVSMRLIELLARYSRVYGSTNSYPTDMKPPLQLVHNSKPVMSNEHVRHSTISERGVLVINDWLENEKCDVAALLMLMMCHSKFSVLWIGWEGCILTKQRLIITRWVYSAC